MRRISVSGTLSFDITDEAEFACPFCRQLVTTGRIVGSNHQTVMHTEPMCDEFERLDPLDYLHQVNVKQLN